MNINFNKPIAGSSIRIGARSNVRNDGTLTPGSLTRRGVVTNANFYEENGIWKNPYDLLAVENYNGQGVVWMPVTSGSGMYYTSDFTATDNFESNVIGTIQRLVGEMAEVFLNVLPSNVSETVTPPIEDYSSEDLSLDLEEEYNE